MLPALIRRKLPRDVRSTLLTLEDAATSTVLGALQYLPWDTGLGALVRRLGLKCAEPGHVQFWPRVDGTEPDALLSGPDWVILVEAKVGAGFGPLQLGREWAVLNQFAGSRRPYLLVLTPDGLPQESLDSMVRADLATLGFSGPAPMPSQLHSLRWHELLPKGEFETHHERAIVRDLQTYMETAGLARHPFRAWDCLFPPDVPATPTWYRRTQPARSLVGFPTEAPPLPPSSRWYGA